MTERYGINQRTRIRFAALCSAFIVPPSTILLAYVLEKGGWGTAPAPWLETARTIFIALSVVYLAIPFFTNRMLSRSAERMRKKGTDPILFSALMCVSCSAAPATFAVLLVFFARAPATLVYTWAPISFVFALYWVWRFRRTLSGSAESTTAANH